MSLLKKANIINIYTKNPKKSIRHEQVDRKDIFLVLAIIILILTPVIINLFNNIYTKTAAAVAAASRVNLHLSPYYEEFFGKELAQKLLQEFNNQNSDLFVRLAGETTEPDILFFNEGQFSALAAGGALKELNSFTNYDSGTQQLAIPLVSFMDLLFYNIDILTAAGFDRPPKTRDEFTAYARAVSRGNSGASGAGISLSQNDPQALSRDIFSWIWAAGGNFWSDSDRPSLNTRAIASDLTFFGTLNREGLLAPGVFETTGEQRLEQFARGRTAMMVASTQVIPYLIESLGDAFGITTIPDPGTGGIYGIGISAIYTAISAGSEHPEEAWRFLEFLAGKSYTLCAELKAVPGIVSNIIPGDYVIDDPFYSKAWDIFESAQIAEDFSGKPGAEEYKSIFLEELQIFFVNNRTAQQTVTAIQQRWNEVEQ